MKLDNLTWWSSACKMLTCLSWSHQAISATLAILPSLHCPTPLDLTSKEWQTLDGLLELLTPICCITTHISGQQYPTVGEVMPIIQNVLATHLMCGVSEDGMVYVFKEKVHTDLAGCWNLIARTMPNISSLREGVLKGLMPFPFLLLQHSFLP
jgi:hypothetical protein